jgi:hypothetical protein
MYDYQRAVQIRTGRDTLICNWARGLGQTFTIMSTILEERPHSILYFKSQNDGLRTLSEKYKEIIKMFDGIRISIKDFSYSKEKIEITFNNGQKTTIYNWYMLPIEYGVRHFDYIFFEGLLPAQLKDIHTNRTVSFVTMNNYDFKLEKMFGDKTVSVLNEDYNSGIKVGLLSQYMFDTIKSDTSTSNNLWYGEYDILSKPTDVVVKQYIDTTPNRKYELYQSYAIDNPSKRFIIDSLIGLEEEYDSIDKSKDTVLTRKNLLEMIIQLQRELNREH